MSFISNLTVDGKAHVLLRCSYKFDTQLDTTGKPVGKVSGGVLDLVLEADGTQDLIHWMLLSDQLKDGSITFYKRDVMATMQSIDFVDGACFGYNEIYSHDEEEPLQIGLQIAVKSLSIADVPFKSNWAES